MLLTEILTTGVQQGMKHEGPKVLLFLAVFESHPLFGLHIKSQNFHLSYYN
jgi:hypothetical protein